MARKGKKIVESDNSEDEAEMNETENTQHGKMADHRLV
jgi:hypothetical protein